MAWKYTSEKKAFGLNHKNIFQNKTLSSHIMNKYVFLHFRESASS